jgi:hypothetical protein
MDSLDRIEAMLGQIQVARNAIGREDYLLACRAFGNMAETFPDLASDCAQEAHNRGATKKSIALALGISPSALQGMKKMP